MASRSLQDESKTSENAPGVLEAAAIRMHDERPGEAVKVIVVRKDTGAAAASTAAPTAGADRQA